MNLSIGIVGLPNVGKSTLFNALLQKQQALAANYPFATVDPNVGIVPVPDARLHALAEVVAGSELSQAEGMGGKEGLRYTKLPPEVPATVKFTDIAGIVKDAHKGEGLGNQFLSHIREVHLIAFVIRAFTDADVVETGSQDIGQDLETVKTELIMKDLETITNVRAKAKRGSLTPDIEAVLTKLDAGFNDGKLASEILSDEELGLISDQWLLTAKPAIYVLNVDESSLADAHQLKMDTAKRLDLPESDIAVISAQTESELASLEHFEQVEYLEALGVESSGLSSLIQLAYRKLGLISFLTAGVKECRAWTISVGSTAQEAAGTIHTDFAQKFIKADVVSFQDFVELKGWKQAKEKGKVRSEGRDYLMQDGDVVEFKIGR